MPFVDPYHAGRDAFKSTHAATDQFPIDQPRWRLFFEQQATNPRAKKKGVRDYKWRPYSLSITPASERPKKR
ncbi:MAG: hypothetical protein IPM55_17825 [Acidobacteria bacterium]|nr:hypothetical protein [Acidobacteriota bacterium]